MIYYLDGAELPTIPVPHDCVIDNISFSDNFLIFGFEEGISIYDSIQHICPDAKSLTIKIHLIDSFDIYQEIIRKFPKFKRAYVEIDFNKLVRLGKQIKMEYLYHYVAYQSLIVNLYCKSNIILDLRADYIEYIWKV